MSVKIIGGKFKGRPLLTPKNKKTRPTQAIIREAVFNICREKILNARFFDLFAGSGAIGLEAMSRGALYTVFVDKNYSAISCIKKNIGKLDLTLKTKVLFSSAKQAIQLLAQQNEFFDILYIDPPYTMIFDIETVIHLTKPTSLIFLEQTKGAKPIFTKLRFKDQKIFGTSQISIFENVT